MVADGPGKGKRRSVGRGAQAACERFWRSGASEEFIFREGTGWLEWIERADLQDGS